MSFQPGSLSWPDDLKTLPLLVRHDHNCVAGGILNLEYDGGRLFVRARVEHSEAARMGAFSITATIVASEIHNADSSCFHAVITKAIIAEISLTPAPANAHALVTSRRDVSPLDDTYDNIIAAVARVRQGLAAYADALPSPPPPEPPQLMIKAAPAFIIGGVPRPPVPRRQIRARTTQFSALAAALNERLAP